MKKICESEKLDDYLIELNEVNYSNPIIREKVEEIFYPSQTEIEKAKVAFEFVRDEISHSWDIQGKRVTCNASDVLPYKEGIYLCKIKFISVFITFARNSNRFLLSTLDVV